MTQLDTVKRIIVEDFKKEDREVAEKLALILNQFMEQTYNIMNGNVDFLNLNQEIVDITVVVDANGQVVKSETNSTLVSNPQFTADKVTRAVGSVVIAASNLTDRSVFPDSAPFVSFSIVGEGVYKINKISGLQANNKYSIRLILFGN